MENIRKINHSPALPERAWASPRRPCRRGGRWRWFASVFPLCRSRRGRGKRFRSPPASPNYLGYICGMLIYLMSSKSFWKVAWPRVTRVWRPRGRTRNLSKWLSWHKVEMICTEIIAYNDTLGHGQKNCKQMDLIQCHYVDSFFGHFRSRKNITLLGDGFIRTGTVTLVKISN